MSSNETTTSGEATTNTTVTERPHCGGAGKKLPTLLRALQEEVNEVSVNVSAGDDSEAQSLNTFRSLYLLFYDAGRNTRKGW